MKKLLLLSCLVLFEGGYGNLPPSLEKIASFPEVTTRISGNITSSSPELWGYYSRGTLKPHMRVLITLENKNNIPHIKWGIQDGILTITCYKTHWVNKANEDSIVSKIEYQLPSYFVFEEYTVVPQLNRQEGTLDFLISIKNSSK